MKKYKYVINNLDCANCAREIEEYMNSLDEFNNVVVNFNTSRVIFESDKCFSLDELNKIVSSVEDEAYLTLNEENSKEYHLSVLIVAILLSLVAYIFKTPKWLSYSLYIISYVLLLYKIAFSAVKMLIKNHILNEYALITISCLGAFFIGDIMEGIMVVSLYTIGKILEEKAINNSRKSIKNLIDIKQSYASVLIDDELKKVAVEDVKIDDIMEVQVEKKSQLMELLLMVKQKSIHHL